jgi:hypothetical protein
MMTMIQDRESGGQLLCLAIAAVGLAFGIYAFVELVRAARSERTPAMVRISPTGLTADRSTPGWRRRYEFPINVIRRTVVELEGPLLANEFRVRLMVLTLEGEAMTFLFTLCDQQSVDALKAALRRYLVIPAAGDLALNAMNVEVRLD